MDRVWAGVREAGFLLCGMGKTLLFVYLPLLVVVNVAHFPYDTDPSLERQSGVGAGPPPAGRRSAAFYEAVYRPKGRQKPGTDYEAMSRLQAGGFRIEDQVRKFVADYGLADKKVLEVGSGRGYLQDFAADYTGLDLSPSVAGHYHKPFVVGSATQMPFPANSYDGVWSVWVLEHIPEPERALMEMRRVLKPGGVLFLYVSWNCPSWAADGFDLRPYSDFNWRGKLVKATAPVRASLWFELSYRLPLRAVRWAHYGLVGDRTRLRFQALDPNYDVYWEPDSDAAISLDSFETYLWFRAQGDDCLNCDAARREWMRMRNPLIVRVRQPA